MAHSPGDEPTRRAIAKALRSKEVRDGIAAAVARYAKAHIAKGEGRGPSGQAVWNSIVAPAFGLAPLS